MSFERRDVPVAIAAFVVAVVAVAVGVVVVISQLGAGPASTTAWVPDAPGPDHAVPVEPPRRAGQPSGPANSALVDEDWTATVAEATGIPRRALAAYAGAALVKAAAMPECGLGWTTLAAIGLVESDHGRHGGSTIAADGTVTPGIFGVALDGQGSAHIPDSDDGAIDGDSEFDRAVGPMQLIPQTWRNWHVDGNGDGFEDPQNLDDAVTATSNYLCRASGEMAGRDGWRAGIAAYNASDAYVQEVADAANRYAVATARATGDR